MSSIKHMCDDYVRMCSVPESLKEELRHAFYAGAGCSFRVLCELSKDEEDYFLSLRKELLDYAEQRMKALDEKLKARLVSKQNERFK